MSTRIYCDQCGTETSERKELKLSLSGFSRNRNYMTRIDQVDIDLCPECAERFSGHIIGSIRVRHDRDGHPSPYLLEYQSTDLKEAQA